MTLTPRVREALRLTAQGLTGEAIALKMRISVRCYYNHMSIAREQLGADSTPQAIALGIASGDIPLPEEAHKHECLQASKGFDDTQD